MSHFYNTPANALQDDDERRRRHSVLVQMMGLGVPPSTTPVDPLLQYIFFAPLTHSLVPTTAGNPTFTFSRVTTAAYVSDFEGVLRQAIANEARFTGARRVRNWVVNTDFTVTWTIGGSRVTGIADPLGGTTAATFTSTSGTQQFYTSPALSSNAVRNSIWVKRRTGTGAIRLIPPNNGAYTDITSILTTSWQRFATNVSAPSGGTAGFVGIEIVTTGDAVDVAFPQVETVDGQSNQAPSEYVSRGVLASPWHGAGIDGSKDFLTTNGNSVAANVVTEAPGTPIPLATTLGFLAENAATNLCLQSQSMGLVAPWVASNTGSNTKQTAPDGTLTADTLTDTAANTPHLFYQPITLVTATVYTLSAYVKQGTLPWLQLALSTVTPKWANINLATGAAGNKSAGVTVVVTALPNGWYRVAITVTTDGTAGFVKLLGITSDINAADPAYVGTGQTMFLWGAQVETGDMSSYIPTTTVAVIRNIDQLEYPTATNVGSSVGTIYSEAYLPPSTATNRIIFRWDAADVLQYITGGKLSYITPAFGGPIQTVNSFVPSTVNKCATGYGASTGVGCLNGGTVINGAFVATLPAATNFRLGGGAGENPQGTIRNVKVYATRLADVELQTLTAP